MGINVNHTAEDISADGGTVTIDGVAAVTDSSSSTLTNKTFDANGTGNSLSNVDVADLADGTDGELVTWDAAGSPATVAVGTADQVLTSNGVGAAPTFQTVEVTASSSNSFTNKTFDANATGNSLSNVDVADLANGTDGELITWDAAGAPATVAVGTSGHVLTSNGVGAAPTFQAVAGGSGGTVQGTDATYDIQGTNDGATDGNARGENSVDLSTLRSAATMVASGVTSTIVGGQNITATGDLSGLVGGSNNTASGTNAGVLAGDRAVAADHGQHAHAAGRFSADGDAQGSHFILRKSVTHSTAAWTALNTDGSAARLNVAANTAMAFTALIVGATSGMTKSFAFEIKGLIENDGGVTTIKDSSLTTIDDSDDNDFAARVSADDTNDALLIEVSDSTSGSDVVQWVAHVMTTEVTFA